MAISFFSQLIKQQQPLHTEWLSASFLDALCSEIFTGCSRFFSRHIWISGTNHFSPPLTWLLYFLWNIILSWHVHIFYCLTIYFSGLYWTVLHCPALVYTIHSYIVLSNTLWYCIISCSTVLSTCNKVFKNKLCPHSRPKMTLMKRGGKSDINAKLNGGRGGRPNDDFLWQKGGVWNSLKFDDVFIINIP